MMLPAIAAGAASRGGLRVLEMQRKAAAIMKIEQPPHWQPHAPLYGQKSFPTCPKSQQSWTKGRCETIILSDGDFPVKINNLMHSG
jgi:hypothetical protein